MLKIFQKRLNSTAKRIFQWIKLVLRNVSDTEDSAACNSSHANKTNVELQQNIYEKLTHISHMKVSETTKYAFTVCRMLIIACC